MLHVATGDHSYGAAVGGPPPYRKETFMDSWLRGLFKNPKQF